MVRIQIDGTFYEVKAGKNLLETCLALGFDIPYFCFHPAMGSVGACRLCAVKKFANPDDKKGRIVMSCMEQVTDGMIISVIDPEVKTFRASVLESLMTNHPHDCPICDEGGECHLQDMTVMTGHNYRRFIFKKRTHLNQYLGPFIQHEMNRCIQCYRCVRFYKDYAGGKDLNVFGSANRVYFGRQKDGVLENEFSGNLVEVCPTGVFTDKTLKKHYARKWDFSNAPSICNHCSLGCNIILCERYGLVRRVMSRYNGSVNGYFLCDRGRFGYEFLNDPGRIQRIHTRDSKISELARQDDKSFVPQILMPAPGKKVIGIGSPRASLEANFALSSLVGKDNFFHGISAHEQKLARKAVQLSRSRLTSVPSLKDVEKCDAVLILGEDITNTAPMLALAVRQAARNKSIQIAEKLGIPAWNDVAAREMDQDLKSPLYIMAPFSTKLDELASEALHLVPGDIARFGFAIASLISSEAPDVPGFDKSLLDSAGKIAKVLKEAANPLLVTGTSLASEEILHASANIVRALSQSGKTPSLSIIFPECNSAGLAMLDGGSLDEALSMVENEETDTMIILENDLYRRAPKDKVDRLFDKCHQVIVLDHLSNPTAMKADLLLPVASFALSTGTIVNNEGRAQRYYKVLPSEGNLKESWEWISVMKRDSEGAGDSWKNFDDVVNSLAETYPVFSVIKEQMPDAGFKFYNEKIARQTLRFSGRTAMNANVSVHEPKPPQDNDSPLNFSMEGYKGYPPASLTPYFWSPGWNSPQAINTYLDEPNGHLREGGDPGINVFGKESDLTVGYFKDMPGTFKPERNDFLFVPVYLIFGSEELSSRGEAVSELTPTPFVLLNDKEIHRLRLDVSEFTKAVIDQTEIDVNIKEDQNIPDGVAGLSYLLPGMPFVELPSRGRIVSV